MEISINVPTLIDRAKRESGMTLGQMAKEMHKSQTRFSEWLSGKAEPGTDEIAYLADKAKLPILDTVQALKPTWAHIWARAAEQAKEVRKLYVSTFRSSRIDAHITRMQCRVHSAIEEFVLA